MDSNITLRSNVYINETARPDDERFLQHITDYKVLKRYKGSSYGLGNNAPWMTPVQQEILRQGPPNCSLERGTMSWGVPVGGEHMVCRCEQYDCSRYSICSKYPNYSRIVRRTPKAAAEEAKSTNPWPHSLEQPEAPRALHAPTEAEQRKESAVPSGTEPPAAQIAIWEMLSDEKTADAPRAPKQEKTECAGGVRTVSQAEIIHADLSARIWVNAGPGTGKTYTVIQRLKKLLNDGVQGTVLVLCFSRNAVQVIRERLAEALGPSAAALMEDGRLSVRTFDSFATYMLENELDPAWDYEQRIEAMIETIGRNRGVLRDMIGYFIVDEIQDTVGARARMLLALIDELECGMLLLGDSCQAIFDWTIRDKNDMTFAELAAGLESRGFRKYELSDNRRQNAALAEKAAGLREKILTGTEDEQETAIEDFKAWARKQWTPYRLKELPKILHGGADLVLCKTNGEAALVNQRLFESPVNVHHVMKQSSSHRSLAAWIAKTLKGNDGHFLSKEDFMNNAAQSEVNEGEEKWRALKSLDGHPNAPVLHIQEVLAALSRLDGVPGICLNRRPDCAVISTVHRAKGSEAAHVFWLDSPLVYDNQQAQEGTLADSVRAAYVAATRARQELHMLNPEKNMYMRSVNDLRWIQIGYSKSKKPYCKGIAVLPEDVDEASFVPIDKAEAFQERLSVLEPGIPVTLWPNTERRCFDIYFDGQPIGQTSAGFTADLFAGFEATNHNKNWPSQIPDVYVAEITTVVAPGKADIDPKYRTGGCWLGIELGGFPVIEWY